MSEAIVIGWGLETRHRQVLIDLRDGWQKAPLRGKIRSSMICRNLAKRGLLRERKIKDAYLFCLTPLGCQVQKEISKGLPPKPRGRRLECEPTEEQRAVLDRACEMFGVKPEMVYQRNRTQIMQDVRQSVVMALHRKWPKMSYKTMVKVLGRDDHSMAIYWLNAGMKRIDKEEWLADVVAELCGEEPPAREPIDHKKLADFWAEKEASIADLMDMEDAMEEYESRDERAAMKEFSDNLLAAIISARMAA